MAERLKRIGTGTILLPNRPGIAQTAAIVGKKEGEGPLHSEFDAVIEDDLFDGPRDTAVVLRRQGNIVLDVLQGDADGRIALERDDASHHLIHDDA